jgi:hypothetical protein
VTEKCWAVLSAPHKRQMIGMQAQYPRAKVRPWRHERRSVEAVGMRQTKNESGSMVACFAEWDSAVVEDGW